MTRSAQIVVVQILGVIILGVIIVKTSMLYATPVANPMKTKTMQSRIRRKPGKTSDRDPKAAKIADSIGSNARSPA